MINLGKTEFLKSYVVCVSDYKSNLLREKAHMSPQPKVIDLDKGSQTSVAMLVPYSKQDETNSTFSFHRNAEIR